MQLKLSIIGVVAALVSVSIALPTPDAAPGPALSDLEARASTGHIYICTEGGFSGSCTNYRFSANTCTNFPSGFDNQISSMGPDSGWFCVTFVNYNCDYSGYTYTVTNPGYSSLPPGIDNALSSIICYPS